MEDDRPFLVRKMWLVIALLFVGVLILAAFIIYRAVAFRVTGTDPGTNSVATVSPFFKISFNKPLPQSVSVSFYPQNFPASYKISGSSVIVTFGKQLQEGATYNIRLSHITDVAGSQLSDKVFVFQAQSLSSSSLSTAQQKALEAKQASFNAIKADGLVQLLPFTSGGNEFTVSYNVDYTQQSPRLIIVISAATPQGQGDAVNWIRQVGFDPSKYTITFVSPPNE